MSGAGGGAVIHWHHRTAVSTELLLSCTLVHDVVSVPMATVSKWVLYYQSMPPSQGPIKFMWHLESSCPEGSINLALLCIIPSGGSAVSC